MGLHVKLQGCHLCPQSLRQNNSIIIKRTRSKLLELLTTQVEGSVQRVLLEIFWRDTSQTTNCHVDKFVVKPICISM